MFKYRKPLIYLFIVSVLGTLSYVVSLEHAIHGEESEIVAQAPIQSPPVGINPFGIEVDSFKVITSVIKPNQFLADILLKHHVPYTRIHELAVRSKDTYDVRRLSSGKSYTLYLDPDSLNACYFIYEPNAIDYVIYDLNQDSVVITQGARPLSVEIKLAEGRIEYSLYESLKAADCEVELAFEMAEILAWSIDFYRLQKGDHFKVVYEVNKVYGNVVGLGKILALRFVHEGNDFYGTFFEQDGIGDYFDKEANSLRKAFLKSPLKFSRLTSGFTRRRFHPVQKRWKAHLGTDYAAPNGTPILATGDGVIAEARYKRYNGNYVKIRHNGTYQTQYLHMSKIHPDVKPGVKVEQGQIIGYVGSTGLATGPHVCYRFWKNGSQVNHLNEDFPPAEPVDPSQMDAFHQTMAMYSPLLTDTAVIAGH